MNTTTIDTSVSNRSRPEEYIPAHGEVYKLVHFTDKILTSKLENFDFANLPIDPNILATNLLKTMYTLKGAGLSANQVGLPYRVFVMRPNFACFNPRVVLAEDEEVLEEGCLTFPGITIKVKRAKHIKVRFATPSGTITTQTFTGMTARIFQHELTHLEGKFFFEGIGRMKMETSMRKAKKLGFDYNGYNLMKYAVT